MRRGMRESIERGRSGPSGGEIWHALRKQHDFAEAMVKFAGRRRDKGPPAVERAWVASHVSDKFQEACVARKRADGGRGVGN